MRRIIEIFNISIDRNEIMKRVSFSISNYIARLNNDRWIGIEYFHRFNYNTTLMSFVG